jgi:hypothetical protein
MAAKKRQAKRGEIGPEIFAQIEKLVAAEKIGRTEAFRRLAKTSGRQPGTVAANYYRIARRKGAKLAPRRRRNGGGRIGTAAGVVQRATAALQEVAGVIRKLEEQVAQLRRENQRVAAIRRLVAR